MKNWNVKEGMLDKDQAQSNKDVKLPVAGETTVKPSLKSVLSGPVFIAGTSILSENYYYSFNLFFFFLLILFSPEDKSLEVKKTIIEPLPPKGQLGNAFLQWILCFGFYLASTYTIEPQALLKFGMWVFGVIAATATTTMVFFIIPRHPRLFKCDSHCNKSL